MKNLKVVEIFDSIEGEGIRTGMPVTFIRLAGCNLRCKYCDTWYAQEATQGDLMSLDEIVNKVTYDAVTITGGEPLLHQDEIIQLINLLQKKGHYINIETNGSIELLPFVLAVRAGKGFFTVDYKCPCSGEEEKMLDENFLIMNREDVLKFVVAGEEDLSAVRKFLLNHCNFKGIIFISPCFNMIKLEHLVDEVKILKRKFPKFDIRFQVQLHKIVYPADMRGV